MNTPAPERRKPLVLVVDDEYWMAQTLTQFLNLNGLEAIPAYTGGAALAFALALRPDLLITDYNMPGMDGICLAQTLHSLLPACKILLCSGVLTREELDFKLGAGHGFTVLEKPVFPQDLLAEIRLQLSPAGHPGAQAA
jgi:CheY-like chemotaxis protein